MQNTMRSMLATFGVRRVRSYDTGAEALTAMLADPPSVVITAWKMEPMDGARLLHTMRDANFPSLCTIPVIVATAHATLSVIDAAFSAGCNALLSKPLSPQVLHSRLEWLVRDDTMFVERNGRIEVEGMSGVLDARVRNSPLAISIRHASALEEAMRGATEPAQETAAGQGEADIPAPATEPEPETAEATKLVTVKPRRRRTRSWHGWDIDRAKGSTAA